MPTIENILSQKLIPWAERNCSSRIIVARDNMTQAEMPSGVRLDPWKIPSKRVVVKNKRVYSNVRNVIATWPDAGLQELGKYALACVFNGFVDYPLGSYKIKCGAVSFMFIPPGIPWTDGNQTYVDLENARSCDVLVFLLHPGALEIWTSHCDAQGRDQDNNRVIFSKQIITLFEMLIDEVVHKKDQQKQVVEKLLSVFFDVVLRDIKSGNFQHVKLPQQLVEAMSHTDPNDFLGHLQNYVQTNLGQPMKLNTVASDMYLSRAQFARVIRRETGKSFGEYVTEKRLQKAKKLLIESEWAIKAIFDICGFASIEYFCAVFKKHTGKTPSQYRKIHKNQ